MDSPKGHILKSNNVKLEGQFRLDAEQTPADLAHRRDASSASAQVRIVENHPEFAVMEVTCRCGIKTHIRCQYTDAHSTDQGPSQISN